MKKILLSLAMIAFAGALVAGATGAFFSDSETSTGNVLAAGAIDLGIDNTSYYNGRFNPGTSWSLDFDLDDGCPNFLYDGEPGGGEDEDGDLEFIDCLFFNFDDLKPGDFGEDTISLHVTNNEAWLCADVTLTSNDDVSCTEPEDDLVGGENGDCENQLPAANADGDLAQNLTFMWWADDGDNVFECVFVDHDQNTETPAICDPNAQGSETLLHPAGILSNLGVGNTAHVALADSDESVFGTPGPILTDDPREILYIGKAWCFGNFALDPELQDGGIVDTNQDGIPDNGPDIRGAGFSCNGASIDNKSQTDQTTLNVSFRAEQARHNESFQCQLLPA